MEDKHIEDILKVGWSNNGNHVNKLHLQRPHGVWVNSNLSMKADSFNRKVGLIINMYIFSFHWLC